MRLYNFNNGGSFQLTYGDKKFEEKRAFFVDSNFFRVFSILILSGDARTALMKPHAVVLTETTAKKYFGNADPMGKVLTLYNQFGTTSYTVEGVFENMGDNSDIRAGRQ